jgi:RNA polymerase sigma-70 factor (ECF subfamily)
MPGCWQPNGGPVDGWPDHPERWIYTTAYGRAIDRIRRERSRTGRHEAADAEIRRREFDDLDRREERWHSGVDAIISG